MRERVTVIGELFPGRGLEGWGIGYLATNAEHVGDVTKLKQVMSICTSTPSQFAALAASHDDGERRASLLGQLREARSAAVEAANAAGFEVVEGAAQNVLALRHADLAAMKTALDAAGVRYADGAAFGADDVLRVAVAATGATTEALQNLR